MATINDPIITEQIRSLAAAGTVDVNRLVQIVNSGLQPAEQIVTGVGATTGIFKKFGQFDRVDAKIEIVTTGIWSGDAGSMTTFFTSSEQVVEASAEYYYNIYSYNPQISSSAEAQYAIAYGHVDGSGSMLLSQNDDSKQATKATYAQYRTLLLDDPTAKFKFENSAGVAIETNDVYVINVNRARYREEMDAGNWSLAVSGSNGLVTFVDDSGKKFGDTLGKAGRVFKVAEGALNLGTQSDTTINSYTASNGLGYGLFYPDRGIIVLNPAAIGNKIGNVWNEAFQTVGTLTPSYSTAAEQYNQKRLYYAIKAGGDFEARRTERISTQHYFVRANNREFNYSNNPTYIDSDGFFTESSFETDPQTYITTVGLLNDSNELLAVAKTSQPIVKSFDKEVLIKVKLSF
jgi:hypothetical protein